jgi:hypothetical protein
MMMMMMMMMIEKIYRIPLLGWIALLLHIQEVLDSNLGQEIGYSV